MLSKLDAYGINGTLGSWIKHFLTGRKQRVSVNEVLQRCSVASIRAASRMTPGLKEMSYEERLDRLNLPSLYYRRALGDRIEEYKLVKDAFSIATPYIKLEETGSRGQEINLKKEGAVKSVRFSSSLRINNNWNIMNTDWTNTELNFGTAKIRHTKV